MTRNPPSSNRLRASAVAAQVNAVRNSYLPEEWETWAQLRPTPEDFLHESFVSKDIEPGVREISGTLKTDGTTAPAAYCFASPAWDANSAQAWLNKKGINPAKLDPPKDTTYRQITAKGVSLSGGAFRLKAEGATLPKLDILVYTGGPVQPEGWDLPIIVDLAGLTIPDGQTPVLFNHDPDQVVGHGIAMNSGRELRLKGVVSSIGPAAQQVPSPAGRGAGGEGCVAMPAGTGTVGEGSAVSPPTQASGLKPHASPTWAMLIKRVYEVDPLICPECGGQMKVMAFIEPPQADVIEKIMRHCGLWQAHTPRPPPVDSPPPATQPAADESREWTYVDMDTFWATF